MSKSYVQQGLLLMVNSGSLTIRNFIEGKQSQQSTRNTDLPIPLKRI